MKDIGKLNMFERDKIWEWLKAYRKNKEEDVRKCPYCGELELDICDQAVNIVVRGPLQRFGNYYASATYPSILLVCENCGYSMLFNASTIGLIGPPEEGNG